MHYVSLNIVMYRRILTRDTVGTYLVCVYSAPPAYSPSAAVGTRRLPVALLAGTPGGTLH